MKKRISGESRSTTHLRKEDLPQLGGKRIKQYCHYPEYASEKDGRLR
jgi:hypothetical protein